MNVCVCVCENVGHCLWRWRALGELSYLNEALYLIVILGLFICSKLLNVSWFYRMFSDRHAPFQISRERFVLATKARRAKTRGILSDPVTLPQACRDIMGSECHAEEFSYSYITPQSKRTL